MMGLIKEQDETPEFNNEFIKTKTPLLIYQNGKYIEHEYSYDPELREIFDNHKVGDSFYFQFRKFIKIARPITNNKEPQKDKNVEYVISKEDIVNTLTTPEVEVKRYKTPELQKIGDEIQKEKEKLIGLRKKNGDKRGDDEIGKDIDENILKIDKLKAKEGIGNATGGDLDKQTNNNQKGNEGIQPEELGKALTDLKDELNTESKNYEVAEGVIDKLNSDLSPHELLTTKEGFDEICDGYANGKISKTDFDWLYEIMKMAFDPIKKIYNDIMYYVKFLPKFVYYAAIQPDKVGYCSQDSKDDCFYLAKKQGYVYFYWKGDFYNTETNMPLKQETLAYANEEDFNIVGVDYFPMGNIKIAFGFGHLQTYSVDEPQYQINPWPSGDDWLASLTDIEGEDDSTVVLNKKFYEDYTNNKETIYIKMNDFEYENFKKVCGDWAGKKANEVSGDKQGESAEHYNFLFKNCSQHTVRAVIPNINIFNYLISTPPVFGIKMIKKYYNGRYTKRSSGQNYIDVGYRTTELMIPKEYEDSKYVIVNATTIISNRFTIIVQETLSNQLLPIFSKIENDGKRMRKEELDAYKQAYEQIKLMVKKSKKKNGSWDKTSGIELQLAIKDTQNLINNYGYKPENVDFYELYRKAPEGSWFKIDFEKMFKGIK